MEKWHVSIASHCSIALPHRAKVAAGFHGFAESVLGGFDLAGV